MRRRGRGATQPRGSAAAEPHPEAAATAALARLPGASPAPRRGRRRRRLAAVPKRGVVLGSWAVPCRSSRPAQIQRATYQSAGSCQHVSTDDLSCCRSAHATCAATNLAVLLRRGSRLEGSEGDRRNALAEKLEAVLLATACAVARRSAAAALPWPGAVDSDMHQDSCKAESRRLPSPALVLLVAAQETARRHAWFETKFFVGLDAKAEPRR